MHYRDQTGIDIPVNEFSKFRFILKKQLPLPRSLKVWSSVPIRKISAMGKCLIVSSVIRVYMRIRDSSQDNRLIERIEDVDDEHQSIPDEG